MKLKVAYHSKNIKELIPFYTECLEMEVRYKFESEEGYYGIVFGIPGLPWEIEFTASEDPPSSEFDEDDLIVLYFDDEEAYNRIIRKMRQAKNRQFAPRNPYWEARGRLYKDPEGRRIVLVEPKESV